MKNHFTNGFFLLALAVGCTSLDDLQTLQAGFQNRFRISSPGIEERNDTVLVIGIEDSLFIRMDSLTRSRTTDSMALFVKDNYPSFKKLSAITIGFVMVSRSGGAIVRTPYYVKSFHVPDLTAMAPIFQ